MVARVCHSKADGIRAAGSHIGEERMCLRIRTVDGEDNPVEGGGRFVSAPPCSYPSVGWGFLQKVSRP